MDFSSYIYNIINQLKFKVMKKLFFIFAAAVVFTSCNTKTSVNCDMQILSDKIDKFTDDINFSVINYNTDVSNYIVMSNNTSLSGLDSIQKIASTKLLNPMIELQYLKKQISDCDISQKNKNILDKRILSSELLALSIMNRQSADSVILINNKLF